MAIATDGFLDPALQWQGAFERVVELVEASTDEAMVVRVPATPDWRARDLLAHVVGLDHDVLAGAEPDDHDPAWTQGHVDDRADRSVTEILAEWRKDADDLLAYLRDVDTRPLGDVIIHEQDLRGALQAPGARDGGGMVIVRGVMAQRLAGAVRGAGLPPLRLETVADDPGDLWRWATHDGEPGAVLAAPSYDLARALHSRRTPDQLRSWVVAGDVEPYLDAFATVGPLPTEPLPE